jgi:methyl-accepting chemotaxis protein
MDQALGNLATDLKEDTNTKLANLQKTFGASLKTLEDNLKWPKSNQNSVNGLAEKFGNFSRSVTQRFDTTKITVEKMAKDTKNTLGGIEDQINDINTRTKTLSTQIGNFKDDTTSAMDDITVKV